MTSYSKRSSRIEFSLFVAVGVLVNLSCNTREQCIHLISNSFWSRRVDARMRRAAIASTFPKSRSRIISTPCQSISIHVFVLFLRSPPNPAMDFLPQKRSVIPFCRRKSILRTAPEIRKRLYRLAIHSDRHWNERILLFTTRHVNPSDAENKGMATYVSFEFVQQEPLTY